MTTSADIREFKIDIPNEEVERLKRKLNDTRLPGREIVPDAGTLYEWRRSFDWYRVQGQLNEYPHYLCPIEDLDIHFLHARAGDPDAIPLLLVHGWPGSFYEFSRVWGPLSQPENESAPAFHVVVVSMPWVLLVRLATETRVDSSRQCPSHFNFAPAGLPDEGVGRTDEEQNLAVRADDFLENHLGYAVCMRTRPHTIGLALSDNPMGILMWVGEKYNEAANPENQKHASWKEAILATASLYYFTDCIMPSALCYYENVRHEHFAEFTRDPANRVQVPFGYSSFHWDVDFSSKRAVEKTGNLVLYREHKNGGHFAALECPSDIVQDLREFALQEWKS
ncbi:Alpha/Beta hydrolase protein [Aspergillus keveii]|uniref:Alpha/Beta hydrolase protein n=1 Tax=Aspergillus keveii TaxID=714993 RepID=A0ABR4GKS2_9EURO